MKRKKPLAASAAQTEQAAVVPAVAPVQAPPAMDAVWICLFSVLLFLAMTVQTGRMTMVFTAIAFVLSVGKLPLRRLRQRLCVPVLGLLLFALMEGLAAIYSAFDTYAVKEYYKFLAAFALAVILLVRFEKRHVRGLLWGLAAISAVIALVSIDAASFEGLFGVFNAAVEFMGASFADVNQNTWGARVAGLYNDANVTASIFALGVLVSLYLADSGKGWKERLPACILLGISAQGFLLSMSRGAIFCFVLALLVWLAAAEKGKRLPLFLLMVVTAMITVAASMVSMPAIGTVSVLPDLLAVAAGLGIFLLDQAVVFRVARLLEGHSQTIAVVVAILAVACVGYAVAAVHTTGPVTLNAYGTLARTVTLSPGDYTVSGEWDGDFTLRVTYRTQKDALLGTLTDLYRGPLEGAAFTVPADGEEVTFGFGGEPGTELRQVVLSDGTDIPLGYPLIPDFVANRMQGGLLSSSSFLLRVQYMKDAWKIFVKSPLIGHGLGSTEGLYPSVQPFFYQSLYVHNHILQVMDDMGLLGLAGFLALLGGVLWLLLCRLRKERDPLAAALLACWVMMNAHGLMEIVFSIRAYQCMAYQLLLFPVLLYGKPLTEKAVKWGGWVLSALIWAYLAVFGGLLESHRMVEREASDFSTTSVSEFMDTLRDHIRRDVFDREDNELTYVANAAALDDSRYNGSMRKYVERLRAAGTYTTCSGLARYYYLPRSEFEELFACSREGIAQAASVADAWDLQLQFYRDEVLPAVEEEHMEAFVDGVLALRDYLAEYNQGRLDEITPTEENQAFLDAVSSAREAGMDAAGTYLYLTQILGYGQADTAS